MSTTEARIVDHAELVPYTTATQLAAAFQRHSERLLALKQMIHEEISELNRVFSALDVAAQFTAEVGICNSDDDTQIAREMKRVAWRSLIDRLGIRQFMSMKRKEKFNDALRTPGTSSRTAWIHLQQHDSVDELPDVTPDSIMAVLSGEAASAGEYLRENVVEVYKALKPWRGDGYKTNLKNRWMLSNKVILSYGCRYACRNQWQLGFGANGRLVENLENVFRLLDGKGFRNTHRSEIEDEMMNGPVGETPYFGFKCYGNNNLHLKFLRMDLVDSFNQLAGNSRQLRGRDTDPYGSEVADYSEENPYAYGGYDLFETPKDLADEMCEIAGIGTGSRVLEPSCGPGVIVQAAVKCGACVTAIELQEHIMPQELVTHPAVIATQSQNFLALKPESIGGYFNAVLMNPPFSGGRDCKHIRHAWQFVARGGCLVAVASKGVVFRQDKLHSEFRDWMTGLNGEIIDLPSRSFRESGTDVETVLVVIRDMSEEMILNED